MRRTYPGRAPILGVLVAGAALILTGVAPPKKKEIQPKVDETVADVARIVGADVKVEGVGLVMGLDNTGSDPAPSWQRTKLLDEMRKSGVEHPEKILAWKSCSMVIVRATVPAGVNLSDKFDVEVELPAASATSSLAGGWLVSTQLAQRANTPEGAKDDKVISLAGGAVMPGTFARPDDLKVGRVLGGARVKEDSPYVLSIKEARRSGKTAKLLETVVNSRFHHAEGTDRAGAARAKDNSVLILKVPRTYHHNQDRYFQVIRHLPLVDNPELREKRLEAWGKELLDPKLSGIAAVKLEGLGAGSIPTLKKALGAPEDTVRFFAAEALAYLNDNDGDVARVLAETAKKRPEFRSFALKAMAATDQSASLLRLRSLMSEPEFELRYGAFDALRTLDPTDPFLGKVRVLDPVPEPESADDGMAMQIEGRSWRKPKPKREEPFALYVVDCDGPPMLHVSRNMRCEVVAFGKSQKLLTPVVLGAGGPLLLNASDGDEKVQISKISAKTLDDRARVDSPLDLPEVVRQMANLGASYPEIVAVLATASNQKNLPGPFVVDAVPLANKAYDDAQRVSEIAKADAALKKTGGETSRPSLRDRFKARLGR